MKDKGRRKLALMAGLLTLLLATVGNVFAGQFWWVDPPIPDTPLHLWVPDGAEYNIHVNFAGNDEDEDGEDEDEDGEDEDGEDEGGQPGDVHFNITVEFECDSGTYEAGINASADAPGDWLWHDEANCGKKIKFNDWWPASN